jgi:hypothetical protein
MAFYAVAASALAAFLFCSSLAFPSCTEPLFYGSIPASLIGIFSGIRARRARTKEKPFRVVRAASVVAVTVSGVIFLLVFAELMWTIARAFLHSGPNLSPP